MSVLEEAVVWLSIVVLFGAAMVRLVRGAPLVFTRAPAGAGDDVAERYVHAAHRRGYLYLTGSLILVLIASTLGVLGGLL